MKFTLIGKVILTGLPMEQLIAPHQNLLGLFPNLSAAESGRRALQEAGFPQEQLAILPQSLQPNPPFQSTEAGRSAKGGAIAGTVFGSMAGAILGYMAAASPTLNQADPTQVWIGIALAGSGIGAAAGSLIGGVSGLNVSKGSVTADSSDCPEQYVLVMEQGTSDQVIRAKQLLQELGSIVEL